VDEARAAVEVRDRAGEAAAVRDRAEEVEEDGALDRPESAFVKGVAPRPNMFAEFHAMK
jgi:hypothetical protein